MVLRIIKLSKNNSLFLFGARGTGKSTLLRTLFQKPNTLWIDLLSMGDEETYGRDPDQLSQELRTKKYEVVIIDEIQKAPKLLDIVHREFEHARFILTGSSARKLKRGAANLLAGRAFTYNLHPLTFIELEDKFQLDEVLQYGSLPQIYSLSDIEDKTDFLKSYSRTYLKEEIQMEQIVRNVEPFQDFLFVAAQMNGEIINHAKIGKDVGVDDKTVKSYFEILEDTLLGFSLKPFHRSIRKRQTVSNKFYYFDCGVKNSLQNTVSLKLHPGTTEYGKAFEHFIVLELIRLNDYFKTDFRFSYLRTKDNAEVDVVIERPGLPEVLVEIKSTDKITESDAKTINIFVEDWDKPAVGQLWSNDPTHKIIQKTECLHWTNGLKKLFQIPESSAE